MKISVVSFSLSEQPSSLKEWESALWSEIQSLFNDGAKIILYPELNFMGLTDYFPGDLNKQFLSIANYLETNLLPKFATKLKGKDLLLCLGSAPRIVENKIYNSASVWINDTWIFQDKIHLTPVEVDFTGGSSVQIFEFHGLKTCSLICFDIEQPGLALHLKRQEIDLILVPSATSSKNGNQRINRCASARSIELGAAVVTCPIVGKSKCALVEHAEGRSGFFLPAQEAVVVEQESFSEYSVKKKVIAHFELEVAMMKELKRKDQETKPYFKEDLMLP